MADQQTEIVPRVDSVTGTFFRKGKCEHCGKGSVERTRSVTRSSLEAVNAAGKAWGATALLHKKCEPAYTGDKEVWF